MKKSIVAFLMAAMIMGVFSGCRSQKTRTSFEESNSSSPATEPTTEVSVSENRVSEQTSDVTASSVYLWTERACHEEGLEPYLSSMTTEDDLVEFGFLDNRIHVVSTCEEGFVTQVISACLDKSMLDLAFSSEDYLPAFIKILGFPVYNLGDFDDPSELAVALIMAERIEMDGVVHRSYISNNWLFTLSIPDSDDTVAIWAYYMGETDDVETRECERCGNAAPNVTFYVTESVCDDCLRRNWNGQNPDKYAPDDYEPDDYEPDDYLPDDYEPDHDKEHSCEHRYTEATCLAAETCVFCGETRGMPGKHDYAPATCEEPKTCRVCGERKGYALGHEYTESTCTEPGICTICGDSGMMPMGHDWMRVTETVYHEEQGHYEEVEVAVKANEYQCWLCSYAQPTYKTLDAYYSHFDSAHADDPNSSFFRERYDIVERWTYEYETQWIVDVPAYTDTVTIGYQCRTCGAEK